MARTRNVYPSDMVAHLWANKSQDSARESGGRFYFVGDTIYSYGSHFPIARHVAHKGKAAVLFTTRGYSATTAGHKCMVEGACRHLTVFHVADLYGDHRKEVAEYRKRFVGLVGTYGKARQRKPEILAQLRGLVSEANQYAEFFGLRARLSLPADLSGMVAECQAIEKREKARKQREEAKRARQREAERREAQENIALWADGKRDVLPGLAYDLPIRLRIAADELQTSRGARVPLDHAIKAFRVIKRLRNKGESYQRNGHTIHLGPFALDAIDPQGNVTAGCHHVEWEEIERVATLAGVN